MKYKLSKKHSLSSGQTLAEIVVAIGIVILLIGGLIVGTTSAVRASDQGRMRSLAVKYNQESMELTRQLRDNDWDAFQARSGLWCLDKPGTWTSGGSVCPVNIDNTFTRGASFTWNAGALRMEVATTVSWQDGAVAHQSQLFTYFTQWQ